MNLTTLKSALSRLAPVLHTRTTLPVLSCVKLKSDDASLTIEASNLEQAMRITVPYTGNRLDCCVALKRLMAVPGDGEADMLHSGNKLSIKGRGFSALLETLPPDDFPVMDIVEGDELTLEADYSDALKWVAKAAGTDETKHHLLAVRFCELGMIACDMKRLNIASFQANLGGVNVPATCSKVIAPLMAKGAVLRWNDRTCSIEHGDTLYATRLIVGEYPDVAKAIPTDTGNQWQIDATELSKLVAMVPPNQSAPWVDVEAVDGRLVVRQKDDGNEMEVETECSASGKFRCSPHWLSDMLSGFKGEQTLQVQEVPTGKGIFTRLCIKAPDRTAMLSGMETR